MSGLQPRREETAAAVDVQERGNSLRVATNSPHLVSLGCGRLSTAVTIHPIKQGRVTIVGSHAGQDIPLQGAGVEGEHCRIENSNGVVTLYPVNGVTLVDGVKLDRPLRLSQGCMISIGRSNCLRFNHPAEASLMKSVLPSAPHSGAELAYNTGAHQALDKELHMTYQQLAKKKPPVAPKKPFRDFDQASNSSNSDQEPSNSRETPPKSSGIMSKVSKFEYYVKNSQKSTAKVTPLGQNGSQNDYSPKVFTADSVTLNMPARDVLMNYSRNDDRAVSYRRVFLNENNAVDAKNCSYMNVVVKKQTYDVRQASNVQNVNNQSCDESLSRQTSNNHAYDMSKSCNYDGSARNNVNPYGYDSYEGGSQSGYDAYGSQNACSRPSAKIHPPSASFNRNPVFNNTKSGTSQQIGGTSTQDLQNQRQKMSQGEDSRQKFLEEARLEEILNMCAEYEKQITLGIPTTPTERKPHKQIITNGSLPRTMQHPAHIVPTSDGYFRFDTAHNRNDKSPHRSQSSPPEQQKQQQRHKLSNYENVSVYPHGSINHQSSNNTASLDRRNLTSHHSSYENFNTEPQTVTVYRQDNCVQNALQFPITELSSPVMIRKIARNAQNASNYAYEHSFHARNGETLQSPAKKDDFTFVSPYENMSIENSATATAGNISPYMNVAPNSPNSHSPRTRIKTTYAHKNVQPQRFVFPSPRDESNVRCQGIEKQLSLTEDIPMIDDTEFANELEMRIAKLRPENRVNDDKNDGYQRFESQRRNFEDIRRDLIADIPELDEIHRDIDRNLSRSFAQSDSDKKSLSENLQSISDQLKDVQLEDDVFENVLDSSGEVEKLAEVVESPVKESEVEVLDEAAVSRLEVLRCKRKKVLSEIHAVKAKMADIRCQEDDILRELEMEKALLQGEYDSEMAILGLEQRRLGELQQLIQRAETNMRDGKEQQDCRQQAARKTLHSAQTSATRLEKEFSRHNATLEELRNAQEALDTERKTFEDLEFQHLEEEADWLAHREELQNEMSTLSQKIEAQKSRILGLRFETSHSLSAALGETKALQADYAAMLDRIEDLTAKLQGVESDIKDAVRDIGIEYRDSNRTSYSLEERKSRIKSGDFSPPSSDNEDLNNLECFENRKRCMNEKLISIDHMSRSMIVDLGDKRSINDLIDEDSFNKKDGNVEKTLPDINISKTVNELCDSSPESKEKKQGFWERNFDSLSRLKGKDKKAKVKPLDIMSQSLNENMFFNNENIESEYGSFEKCNSLKNSKKIKSKSDAPTSPKGVEKASKIPMFASLGKMIRKDSFNKKASKSSEEKIADNKENIDLNATCDNQVIKNDGFKMEESPECGVKPRYVKNVKSGAVDNKYLSKCGKSVQQAASVMVNDAHDDDLMRDSYHDEGRDSFTDSLEEEVRIIDPHSGNTIELCRPETNRENLPQNDMKQQLQSPSSKTVQNDMKHSDKLTMNDMTQSDRVNDMPKSERRFSQNDILNTNKNETQKGLAQNDMQNVATENDILLSGRRLSQNDMLQSERRLSQNDMLQSEKRLSQNDMLQPERRPSQNDMLQSERRLSQNAILQSEKVMTQNVILQSERRLSQNDMLQLSKMYGNDMLQSSKVLSENDILKLSSSEVDPMAKVPSQDDIDRISKVHLDAPLLADNADMNSLGRRTIDSLREIQKNRVAILEQKGCQVMDDEREKISELKKRVQTETKLKWEEGQRNKLHQDMLNTTSSPDTSAVDTSNLPDSSGTYGDSTIETSATEKHLRHSATDSYNSSGCAEEDNTSARPLSQVSDLSSDTGVYGVEAPRRSRRPVPPNKWRTREDPQRPLTRYLPIDTEDLNLRAHIQTAGHQVELCPHVTVDSTSCRGYLHKLGAKFHGWSKRWFVFDRSSKTFIYYSDKNEKKPRGGAYFQVIEEVYLDHLNVSKSPTPLTTFVMKTRQRRYYLMAPSGPAARIWIDVLFTGAQGYTEYLH